MGPACFGPCGLFMVQTLCFYSWTVMVCGRIPHKEGLDGGECPSGPTDATGETLVFHSSRKDCRSDTSSVRTKCDFFCFCISS